MFSRSNHQRSTRIIGAQPSAAWLGLQVASSYAPAVATPWLRCRCNEQFLGKTVTGLTIAKGRDMDVVARLKFARDTLKSLDQIVRQAKAA
jgi:hypothetical protein